MSIAHLKPRCAPSLMMVRLFGPTGIDENMNAVTNPATDASGMGCQSDMSTRLVGFVRFFLDFMPPRAREAWPHETVNQIRGEKRGQHVVKNLFLQNQNAAGEQRHEDGFDKGAP